MSLTSCGKCQSLSCNATMGSLNNINGKLRPFVIDRVRHANNRIDVTVFILVYIIIPYRQDKARQLNGNRNLLLLSQAINVAIEGRAFYLMINYCDFYFTGD